MIHFPAKLTENRVLDLLRMCFQAGGRLPSGASTFPDAVRVAPGKVTVGPHEHRALVTEAVVMGEANSHHSCSTRRCGTTGSGEPRVEPGEKTGGPD